MFNVTGGELVIIFMAALVVLGPEKLPEAARFVGRMMAQVREVSQGFQKELRSAMDEVTEPVGKLRNPTRNYLDGAGLPDTRSKPQSAEMASAAADVDQPEGEAAFVPSAPTVPEPVVDWANPSPSTAAAPPSPPSYPAASTPPTERSNGTAGMGNGVAHPSPLAASGAAPPFAPLETIEPAPADPEVHEAR